MEALRGMTVKQKRTVLVAALIFLFCVDRLIKNLIWFSVKPRVGGFLNPVLNYDFAFSLKAPFLSVPIFTVIIGLACIILVLYSALLYQRADKSFFWWGLITTGAASNFLDRITLGGVFDYIDLRFWPVFNVSDMYVTVGIAFFLWQEIVVKKKKKKIIAG